MSAPPSDPRSEEFWRDYLAHPDSLMRFGRTVFKAIPTSPRCQLCAAPFAGAGAPVMRLIGKRPSEANPNICTSCQNYIAKYRGGAEVEGTMLFADIRGSTSIAERVSPAEFHALLGRFYTVASEAVFAHGGFLDKFVGDELVAAFAPIYSDNHARSAIDTARDLLRATGHAAPGGPWAPIGAAVHTGRVWFGAVGEGTHVEVTFLGDPVNVTARLAARAGAGEILVSTDAAAAAGLDADLDSRSLQLKGRDVPVEVVTLTVGTPP